MLPHDYIKWKIGNLYEALVEHPEEYYISKGTILKLDEISILPALGRVGRVLFRPYLPKNLLLPSSGHCWVYVSCCREIPQWRECGIRLRSRRFIL